MNNYEQAGHQARQAEDDDIDDDSIDDTDDDDNEPPPVAAPRPEHTKSVSAFSSGDCGICQVDMAYQEALVGVLSHRPRQVQAERLLFFNLFPLDLHKVRYRTSGCRESSNGYNGNG